jgi:solute carrier family 35 (UDP-xylose/UDP-N-acetylglucosamine transporter), member B4
MVQWTFENPIMWIALFGNSFLSFLGVRGIYNLTGMTTSLTTSLTITVRKFASLIISAVFFQDEAFSLSQWGGALLVMLGSIMYSTSPSPTSTSHSEDRMSESNSRRKKHRVNSSIFRKSQELLEDINTKKHN